jgi:hypothetical protein
MATPGELAFQQFVAKLQIKSGTRYINGHDVQSIGKFFWALMNEQYKQEKREEQGRNSFWTFAQSLKQCLIGRDLEPVISLWADFDQNGKNLFENFYENCLNSLVSDLL